MNKQKPEQASKAIRIFPSTYKKLRALADSERRSVASVLFGLIK